MGKDLKGKELGVGLYQRKTGLYEARAKVDGKQIVLYSTNLSQLKKDFKEEKQKAKLSSGQQFRKLTLNEWYEEWFDTYKAPYIKDTSIVPMKSKYKNTFGKFLGKMRVQDIMNIHVQNAVSKLKSEGRATSSIREALSILTKCMESARNNMIIETNPCFEIQVPWENKKVRRRFLTVEEEERFLKQAKEGWYYEMLYIMLNTGLRIGEVGGLRWSDIDFKNKCLFISNSLSCIYNEGEKEEKLTTLKTQNSYRKIPFIGDVEKLLLSQKKKQQNLKKDLGKRYRAKGELEDVVFCTTLGSPVSRYVAEREINNIVKEINFEETVASVSENREPVVFEKVYPHALRHTFCSRCFEKGIKPKVVQALMGHAHYSTTIDIYTHVSGSFMDEEMKRFAEEMNA